MSKICALVGESSERWNEILGAMIKLDVDLSEKERESLAGCLSDPPRGFEEICK